MQAPFTFDQLETLDLLGLYSDILTELYERGVVRSVNNPSADYAEFLVTKALSLTPAPKSTKGFDATDESGRKYEIKSRRLTRRSRPTRFSAIRGLQEGHFDYLVAVLFEESFLVHRATVFPQSYVVQKAYRQDHVNAWILPISDELWSTSVGRDITSMLRRLQKARSPKVSGPGDSQRQGAEVLC
jgi:hypothetical protein